MKNIERLVARKSSLIRVTAEGRYKNRRLAVVQAKDNGAWFGDKYTDSRSIVGKGGNWNHLLMDWIVEWGRGGIKEWPFGLGVEKLVMQQLGRLGEKQVYSRKWTVPFWHSHVWALESNSLVQIQTFPLTSWVAFSGSSVPVTATQYSCLRIAGKVRWANASYMLPRRPGMY